jgi:hypothetical protein
LGTTEYDCVDTAWEFIKRAGSDGRYVVGGFCEQAMMVLVNALGMDNVVSLFVESWETLSDKAKQNICYDILGSRMAFPVALAERLFFLPATSSSERMTIIGCLFSNRDIRPIEQHTIRRMFEWLEMNVDENNRKDVAEFIRTFRPEFDI